MFILLNVKDSLQNVHNQFHTRELDFGVKGTMKTPGPYYAAVALFCAFCLVIGFAGAADQGGKEKIPCPKNWTNKDGERAGQPFSAEEMITRLEEKGIDVTEVKAALANGNTDAVKKWFATQGRPDRGAMNGTPDFAALITRLEEKGIDVTEVKAALANGDTDAVKEWFDAQRSEGRSGAGCPLFREGKQGHRAGETGQ